LKMMEFFVVNSFAEKPFGGNPAAVFPEAAGLDSVTMQAIARQMNLVETVFVTPPEEAGTDFLFRYFTPGEELPIAGHPTIAAVVALVKSGMIDLDSKRTCRIQTAKGTCEVTIQGDADSPCVFMGQPQPVFGAVVTDRQRVADALGIGLEDLLPGLPVAAVDTGLGHLVVPVKSLDALFRVQRRLEPLRALCSSCGIREVQAFAFRALKPANHLHTRNICPREGIEDPACGVGNGALGAYLMQYDTDKPELDLRAEQGTMIDMPCVIQIIARRHGGIRVSVGGAGKVMIRGVFYLQHN
jgi:trans-2,3-dihydro-3-hydroxyanthranilate isomerase